MDKQGETMKLLNQAKTSMQEKRMSRGKLQKIKTFCAKNVLLILLVLAMGVGIGLGAGLREVKPPFNNRDIMYLRFPGDLLMNMLQMLILPLIVSSLISGLASLDTRSSGKMGLRAIVYYMTTTLAAVVLGIILTVSIQPGHRGGEVEPSGEAKVVDTADTFLDLLRLSGCYYAATCILLFPEFIDLRQLNRILRSLELRRYERTYNAEVIVALQSELSGTGSYLGYRTMTQRLLNRYGFAVPRSVVSELQGLLDPEGVENRRRNRLQRRIYVNKGPNYLIHIDGYDKLKTYGFAIHGAICGYSRRILWLKVADTNNDPAVVASYFMGYVKEIKGVPRCLRIDAGTENVLIADIQKAFRWEHSDSMAAEKSVLIGSSKANQRIEQWWRWARQRGCQFWMDEFAELETIFGYPINLDLARFCFMKIIQEDLDNLRTEWNLHNVRAHRESGAASGKPEIMFNLPQLYEMYLFLVGGLSTSMTWIAMLAGDVMLLAGSPKPDRLKGRETVDYKVPVDMQDVESVIDEWCTDPPQSGCSDDVRVLLSHEMRRIGLAMPSTFREGFELYEKLCAVLE